MANDHSQKSPGIPNKVDTILTRHGGLSHLEIASVDPQQSAAFYEAVLGWKINRDDPAQPKFSDCTGHLIGRWITRYQPAREPGWLPYMYVDRVDEAVRQVSAMGGALVKPPYAEGNLWVATVRDPAGNLLGLWQEM